jgi:hypothetical protein
MMTSKDILNEINKNYQWLPDLHDSNKLAIARFAEKNLIS